MSTLIHFYRMFRNLLQEPRILACITTGMPCVECESCIQSINDLVSSFQRKPLRRP